MADQACATSRRYFPPLPVTTGGVSGQPTASQTLSSWFVTFDRDHRCHYLGSGFLDAPEQLPTGSVRGVDILDVTLGVSAQTRPGEARHV